MQQKPNNILRFIGLGSQMLGAMGIGIFAGYYFDKNSNLNFPLGILLGALLGLGSALYLVIKGGLSKK